MRALIFTPDRNTKRSDYTGAFRPEAHAFARQHGASAQQLASGVGGIRIVRVDVTQPMRSRRRAVRSALELALEGGERAAAPLELVGFFCHGYRNGLQVWNPIAGERSGAAAAELAGAIAQVARGDVRIPLYACSTGAGTGAGGDGGFADRLRDALCNLSLRHCRIDAHTTAGHCSHNPHVRRFEGGDSPVGGTGGQWIVAPRAEQWGAWRRALRGPLRFEFPLLASSDIHRRLFAVSPLV
jgi:hypothetical protein